MDRIDGALHGGAVIQRKISVPEEPDLLVDRPRLEHVLAGLIDRHQVVLVLATAGAGKTTAVRQATARVPGAVAWLSVDTTEGNPGRLLAYLEEAVSVHVPAARGVATGSLRAGVPHIESAGLLAQALADHRMILVLDDLERLGQSPEAWESIGAFLHRLTDGVRVVMVSRQDIPVAVHREVDPSQMVSLGESDLAFTVEEAALALRLHEATIDAADAVAATGGWVTGVLFEAWRSDEHSAVVGGEADPLHGYISSRILAELSPADREFLITTSLLDEVSADRAGALGITSPVERMRALRAVHLPTVWSRDGRLLRCHPRFREFLSELFERRPESERQLLLRAHGVILESEGHDEEAVEVLLRAGDLTGARRCGSRAIRRVIERLDLSLAERWLEDFGPDLDGDPELIAAQLMLAWARDDYRRGVAIADALHVSGIRDEIVRQSERAAAVMIFCYGQGGRFDEVDVLLSIAPPGDEIAAVMYSLGSFDPAFHRATPPPLTGGPFDTMVLVAKFWFGLVAEIDIPVGAEPRISLNTVWQIAALRARGHTARALELYERARDSVPNTMSLYVVLPDLFMDSGRSEDAFEALAAGQKIAREAGAHVWSLGFAAGLVRLRIRDNRDTAETLILLEELERDPLLLGTPEALAQARICRGWLELRAGRDEEAVGALRDAVAIMTRGHYNLELPAAAVLLAEAEWRAGRESEADAAADLALAAATNQGSHHLLLQILAEFPAVASRRIDAEAGSDTPWHGIGRALSGQGVHLDAVGSTPRVRVVEFGGHAVFVDDVEVHPRITKSLELLSYLAHRPGHIADRDELLLALFERDDRSTRSYLRQAIHHLNLLLPPQLHLATTQRTVSLPAPVARGCQSDQLVTDLLHAQSLLGAEKLEAIERILARDDGIYLPHRESTWVQDRRDELTARRVDALAVAAEAALGLHQYGHSAELCARATALDPVREVVWRTQMRAVAALGDDDGVLATFQKCELALAQIDVEPAPSTKGLLRQLRR